MNTYRFETNTTMKPYNSRKWWIDKDYVRPITVQAENLKAALKKYQEYTEKSCYITISDNALKSKEPMYIDLKSGESKQIGYVITGKSDFQRDNGSWTTQYIDLWVEISQVIDVDFE